MASGTTASAAEQVLARARGHRREADLTEAALLVDVSEWVGLHLTDDLDEAAGWGDTPIRLGGAGCPFVDGYTVTELAAALGMSPASGRHLVSQVLELSFRLPRLWARVQAGQVQAWKARRIAEHTEVLSLQAAGFVDAQVAGFADRVGLAQVERLVAAAIARFMPELARAQREAAADGRRFDICHDQVSFSGTSRVEGELDLADALDLDEALARGAAVLKDLGNELGLDQRRALAAGEIARAQLGLDLDTSAINDNGARAGTPAATHDRAGSTSRPAREVVIYAHLSHDAITGSTMGTAGDVNGASVVTVEGHGAPLITLDNLREWLNITGQVNVSIRPVLDLNQEITSTGYVPGPRLREQVVLRDRTCAFPWCERPARRLDLDHIDPWTTPSPDDTGPDPDDTGPPDRHAQTRSSNLAPLCRHHHRAKTFTGGTYLTISPGTYAWTSPHGLRFLTDATGTTDLNDETRGQNS